MEKRHYVTTGGRHYDASEQNGIRLTDCCKAYSAYMDDGAGGFDLCCKSCYAPVPIGQGDGEERRIESADTVRGGGIVIDLR